MGVEGLQVDGRVPNGRQALERVLEDAGYSTLVGAVAAHAVFVHPDTVAQTGLKPVFPVIRGTSLSRGTTTVLEDGQEVMYDDNTAPTRAFQAAAGWPWAKVVDLQFNHVLTDSQNPDTYTALWNICVTPAFLAKTTDGSGESDVGRALRFRSWDLFGWPAEAPPPSEPVGYRSLRWAPVTPPLEDLPTAIRGRVEKSKEARMMTIKRLGWLFGLPSGDFPDAGETPMDPSLRG